MSARELRALLVESGLWTALRTRPYSKVPEPDTTPHALFVLAMDSNPHAPNPEVVVAEAREDFELGLRLVAKLCEGVTYLCVADGSQLGLGGDAPVQVESFKGPHPAGTAGVAIHLLAPASRNRTVWQLGYQDVIAIGRLATTGQLPVERVISLAGPPVGHPRLLRTRVGASIGTLTRGELDESQGDVRVISGCVLSGKTAMGPEFGFLGRYHLQVSALRTGGRRLLGWIEPGANNFSILPVFLSKRALMSIGTYERVMPMDIVATYLLRSLVVGDIEQAEALGALELDEEDLALCTFVCPGKTEFGPYLRQNLDRIEKEG
jgi:Na+-transporting NADH:ubiquinone oxidoreductase subunit A